MTRGGGVCPGMTRLGTAGPSPPNGTASLGREEWRLAGEEQRQPDIRLRKKICLSAGAGLYFEKFG